MCTQNIQFPGGIATLRSALAEGEPLHLKYPGGKIVMMYPPEDTSQVREARDHKKSLPVLVNDKLQLLVYAGTTSRDVDGEKVTFGLWYVPCGRKVRCKTR